MGSTWGMARLDVGGAARVGEWWVGAVWWWGVGCGVCGRGGVAAFRGWSEASPRDRRIDLHGSVCIRCPYHRPHRHAA